MYHTHILYLFVTDFENHTKFSFHLCGDFIMKNPIKYLGFFGCNIAKPEKKLLPDSPNNLERL